ncbi:Nitrogen regulatory protein P-II [Zostera marina]|uniref:Nitrogen regulatory protein P-II n=1 Tax=Zostera marina TaxID=29655 RepID=A0A0K9PCC1_ZOSMR|nr:Nitrogen regulatory protein P-II [Zostera marina]
MGFPAVSSSPDRKEEMHGQSSDHKLPTRITCLTPSSTRPWRAEHVSSGLLKMGIRGVTVSDAKGFGAQGGSTERQNGSEFREDMFVAKTKMEIVISKDQVEAVIEKIMEEAKTGEIGDGKIFLTPVSDLIRVRTGERGERAEKMAGGRSEMISVLQQTPESP